MGQLDASIVQLAMPSLETAFDASLNAVSWVAVGYMLAVACALPIFARLAEIAGRKSIFPERFREFCGPVDAVRVRADARVDNVLARPSGGRRCDDRGK